ncbi:transferrin-binding protein-like solute binding protein [Yoonia sp.]|uniref:transferrin-binding protein-like solute binding protein n=1 Tax=Yoonia sp. TaxID=2212373 RepID=UPI003F6D625F
MIAPQMANAQLEPQMQAYFMRSGIFLMFCAIAACGGSGGDVVPAPPVTDPTPGGGADPLTTLEGTALSLAAATYMRADGAGITQGISVTLDDGFLSGGPPSGSFEVFGETVRITNGEATLPDQSLRVIYEPVRSGDYAGAIELIAFDTATGTITGEAHYVVGIQTEPGAMPSGTAIYWGDFQVAGLLNGAAAEYEGGISFDVDFGGNVIGGLDGRLDAATDVDLSLAAVPVVGNGFTGTLGCNVGCSGDAGTIDATFYGPAAAELGGVIAVGFNSYIGAGTFVIPKQ